MSFINVQTKTSNGWKNTDPLHEKIKHKLPLESIQIVLFVSEGRMRVMKLHCKTFQVTFPFKYSLSYKMLNTPKIKIPRISSWMSVHQYRLELCLRFEGKGKYSAYKKIKFHFPLCKRTSSLMPIISNNPWMRS